MRLPQRFVPDPGRPVLLPIKETDPIKAEYAASPIFEGGAAVHPDPDTASLCRPAKKADTRQEFSPMRNTG